MPGGEFLIGRAQSAVHCSIGPGTPSFAGEARTPRSCAAAPLSDYESGSAIRSPRWTRWGGSSASRGSPSTPGSSSSPEGPSGVLLDERGGVTIYILDNGRDPDF